MTRKPQTGRLPDSAEVVQGDFERPESWRAALDGVQSVYLFPFVYAATDHGFVDEAVEAGVTRFVVHSAAAAGFAPGTGGDGALGRHLTEEREAHRGLELLVEASGAEWTHVRPGLLAVNALRWADRIRTERVVREPYASAGYPVAHEADVADVAVAALLTDDHVGAAYTVTGPVKVSQAEQVTTIGAGAGVSTSHARLEGTVAVRPPGRLEVVGVPLRPTARRGERGGRGLSRACRPRTGVPALLGRRGPRRPPARSPSRAYLGRSRRVVSRARRI